MPKNIIVFSDGTGQDGGVRPEQRVSNVYKLYRASRTAPDNPIDPQAQVAFYDPRLGTDIGATALTAPWRFIQKLLGSMTGNGIVRNIADCYAFVINHYEPGDRVFMIGFSRGAYTVRSLANLLMLCGVPTKTPTGPLMRYRKQVDDIAMEAVTVVLEHGAGFPRAQFANEREEQARRFRAKYGSDGDVNSNVAPYFIGVFDTVASLGANAIDENRKDFQRVPWGAVAGDPAASPTAEGPPKLVQMWFSGNHSDIGGSYPEAESRLSDNALSWMIEQASTVPNGLKLGPVFVNGNNMPGTGAAGTPLNLYPLADGVQHCELAGMRDAIDALVDKLPGWMKLLRGWLGRLNWVEEMRQIPHDARVHNSVRDRFKLASVVQCAGHGAYRPEAMRQHDEFNVLY